MKKELAEFFLSQTNRTSHTGLSMFKERSQVFSYDPFDILVLYVYCDLLFSITPVIIQVPLSCLYLLSFNNIPNTSFLGERPPIEHHHSGILATDAVDSKCIINAFSAGTCIRFWLKIDFKS